MKLIALTLCALGLAGLCSTQAVGTTTLLTSVSCIDHKICADPPTRRNSYTFRQTSTPWTTLKAAPKATPSTGSNDYGYPIATHTVCATDHCTTSVDCGNVNSTAVWWPASTTRCTTVDAAEPACTAKLTGAYSCMPVEHAPTSTEDYGGRSQRWVAKLARATSKKSEGYVLPPGITTTKVPWTHSWVPAPTHCYSCIRPSSRSSTTSSTVQGEVTVFAE
ncbi:hypothetical protein Ptr902_04205 [Pyrenophora tritici-repentis]|nr:hypothetical protein Ptr902_04205 [Pyrenophora tritici-repentis]